MKCAVCGAPADGNFSTYGNPRKLEFLDGKCLDWANSVMEYPLLKAYLRDQEDHYWKMVMASMAKPREWLTNAPGAC